MSDEQPLWSPSLRRVAQANLTRFLGGHSNYESLWRWSVEKPDEFWPAVWRFCGVKSTSGWSSVMEPAEGLREITWFRGARLNFAENLLWFDDESPAIIWRNEQGARRELSYKQLRDEVSRCQQGLQMLGVAHGDRVAGLLPNIPEAVIAMLATASLGAIWTSCSPEFGTDAIVDRFAQVAPKVLIAADAAYYGGKRLDILAKLEEITSRLSSLRQTLIVTYQDRNADVHRVPHALRWQDASLLYRAGAPRFLHFEFDHPLYILYSSGTTGLPKCILHGAGGTLLQHLKELVLHTDLKANDRIFYYTNCGWMMWNWLVSALATGACIMLYDGAPFHPGPNTLWDLVSEERVTVFGTSAKYLAICEKEGLQPKRTHDLKALRTILSTGSPLLPQSFDYVYRDVHPDVQLSSISGGTDIVSCFALGNPIGPVYRGQLQVRGLGMNVAVLDEAGAPVVGRTGELVCSPPFPSMPLGFWNDPDQAKYRAAYFERFPGYWWHGDWAELTLEGGLIISGRSDTTLNPGGIRVGTAEIYRQVEQFDEVLESLVVGQDRDGDVRVVLFVCLRPGVTLTPELEARIKRRIREGASPHHVPHKIFAIPALPKTPNGKLTEMAVRDVLHGRPVKNAHILANPEALDYIRDLTGLQD
jgi:acetoacetyl-CoA synthetase